MAAIRRLCLEIGYEYKQEVIFQLYAYRVLQEAAEHYLVRMFKDTNLLATHAKRITIKTKDMILVWRLWFEQHLGMECCTCDKTMERKNK